MTIKPNEDHHERGYGTVLAVMTDKGPGFMGMDGDNRYHILLLGSGEIVPANACREIFSNDTFEFSVKNEMNVGTIKTNSGKGVDWFLENEEAWQGKLR